MTKKSLFSWIFYAFLTFVSFYFSGFIGIISLIISLLLYAHIFYVLHLVWKKIRRLPHTFYKDFLLRFFSRLAFLLTLIFLLFWGFCYYENEINPAVMPFYTLTDGEKTIYFQTMIHIGREDFYKEIEKNIREKKEDGAVLFYEGVKAWTKENMEKFDSALGVEFSRDLYENFSKLYGVTFQDNENFLGIVNNYDFNIDLSIDEIMTLYEEEVKNTQENIPEEVIDVNELLVDELAKINDRQLKVLVYINQAIMNTMIKNEDIQKNLLDSFWNTALFEVILHKRNALLAESIEKSKNEKIFITYGLLHFKWVLKLLQEKNPAWYIKEVQYLYPLSTKH